MSTESTGEDRLEEARRLLRDGKAAAAAACLEALLAAEPQNAEAHAMRGVALGMMGETAAGTRALETAIQLAPPQPIYYFNLGQIREQGGDPGGAVAAYRQALQIDPDYARAAEALHRLRAEPVPAGPAAPHLMAPRVDPTPANAPWLVGAAPEPILTSPAPAVIRGPRRMADAPQIVKSIRWLYWLIAFLYLMGILALLIPDDQSPLPAVERLAIIIVLACLFVINAWMLYAVPRGISAAYYVQMLGSGLGLLSFPLGTLIHGYILYHWSKPESRAWFGIT